MGFKSVYKRRSIVAILTRRHGGDCLYCRVPLTVPPPSGSPQPPSMRTIDHIVPRCKGGPSLLWNLALACRRCNEEKGELLPLEFVVIRIGQSAHSEGDLA